MKGMENQKLGSNRGEIEKPGGRRWRRKRLNFEFEAAQTLACLAHSSHHQDDDADLESTQLYFTDKKVISPEKKQSRERPHGSPRVVRQFCFTTPVVPAKPPFNEADKEAKKMRRMLANRESARQTIRRRQLIFEELTRRAAALALENENLKKRKEEKMRDYISLKETNDALKKVMVEFKVPEDPEPKPELEPEPESTEWPVSGVATTTALLFSPQGQVAAPVPLSWQSLIQSQSDYPTSAAVFHISEAWRQFLLNDSGTSSSYVPNPGGGGALLYVLQLLPNPSQNTAAQIHLCHQCGAATASQSSTPSINRGEVGKTAAEAVDEKPSDPDKGALLSMPQSRVETSCASGSGMGGVNVDFEVQSSSEEAMPSGWSIARNARKRALLPDPMGWLADVGTPAQARKRRRELMKMKSLRLGQFNLN